MRQKQQRKKSARETYFHVPLIHCNKQQYIYSLTSKTQQFDTVQQRESALTMVSIALVVFWIRRKQKVDRYASLCPYTLNEQCKRIYIGMTINIMIALRQFLSRWQPDVSTQSTKRKRDTKNTKKKSEGGGERKVAMVGQTHNNKRIKQIV